MSHRTEIRLDGGQPKRLLVHQRKWALEMEYLRPLDDTVLRPTLRLVYGKVAIVDALNRMRVASSMVDQTKSLFGQPIETGGFEALNGQWFELPDVDASVFERAVKKPASQAPERRKALEQALHSERRHSRWLEQRIERLERRLAAVEAELVRWAHAPPAPRVEPHASDVHPVPEAVSVPPEPAWLTPVELPDAPPEQPGPEPAVAAAGTPEQASDLSEMDLPDEQEEAGPQPIAKMPPARELEKVLKVLVSGDVKLKPTSTSLEAGPEIVVSELIDDDDVVIGAQIADGEAANNLSGKLMMIPDEEIARAVQRGELSEDTVDVVSEVFNTLSSCVNNISSNPHVRTTPARLWSPDGDGWMLEPARRLDLEVLPWGGALTLLTKM